MPEINEKIENKDAKNEFQPARGCKTMQKAYLEFCCMCGDVDQRGCKQQMIYRAVDDREGQVGKPALAFRD